MPARSKRPLLRASQPGYLLPVAPDGSRCFLSCCRNPWVTSNLSTQPHTSFQFAKLTPSLPVKKSLLRSAVSLSSFCKGYSHSAAEHLSRSFHSYDHLVLDNALDALVLGFARMKFTHGAIV
jgi:hypothetical protein